MNELLAFLATRKGRYSITISLPNGDFIDLRYDDGATATALLQELVREAEHTSLDEVIGAIAKGDQ